MYPTKLILSLMVLSALAALAVLASACRPSFEEDLEEARIDAARATEAAQRAQALAALEPLNPLRYHHLDAIVRDEQRIPADAVIWATRAHETLEWVDWPPELREHVDQYREWLGSLLAAFRADDAEAAAGPSKITHALAHTFEAALEAWLRNESLPAVPELAGLEPPTHDSDHSGQHSGQHGGQMENSEHDAHQE